MTDAPGPIGHQPAAVAAAAAGSSLSPTLSAGSEVMLPLLQQCISLRLLRWSSAISQLTDNERYSSFYSWVQPLAKVRWSSALQTHRANKERARERQALRTLLSAIPQLSIEYSVPCSSARHFVVLPPTAGSIAEARTQAAAEEARKGDRYSQLVHGNPTLQAYEDRALLAIELEEEAEWKADAEEKAAREAAAGPKVKRKKRRAS